MKLSTTCIQVGLVSLLCAIPSFASSICDAATGNLVTNCGFETTPPDFSSWVTTPSLSGHLPGIDSSNPNSGGLDATFGAAGDGGNAFIDQTFATLADVQYDVSFFVDATTPFGSDAFVANWNGTPILALSGGTSGGYQFYSIRETGTGGSTDLQFGGNSLTAKYFLDDVIVAPVPEPSSILFAVAGLVGIWLMSHRYAKPVDLCKQLAATV